MRRARVPVEIDGHVIEAGQVVFGLRQAALPEREKGTPVRLGALLAPRPPLPSPT